MVFWIAILVGGLFVWLAVRLGFYETWILTFNIVISIYVAVFLAPAIVALAPGTGDIAPYCTALSLLVLAAGCFALFQGLSYVLLTGQFNIPFPRAFDILFAGLLGFLAGFLALSFVALVVTTTPLAEHKIVSTVGFNPQSQGANIACITRCCGAVHSLVGFAGGDDAARAAVDRLLEGDQDRPSDRGSEAADPNAPATEPRPDAPPERPV